MTHTSSFFASWERLGNRITPRESYPINFLLALLDGASIADIRVCVQREYISNGHRRDSRALCANLQRSQRTRSYRPRRSPATRSTRFTIQPVIRLLFIRALSLSPSLYDIRGASSFLSLVYRVSSFPSRKWRVHSFAFLEISAAPLYLPFLLDRSAGRCNRPYRALDIERVFPF